MRVKWKLLSHVQLFVIPWAIHYPGCNTGVCSLSLLWRIFSTQRLNPFLPHWRWILYQLSHKGSPRILEWITYPISSGSSSPRSWTGVSCIADRFCETWTIKKAEHWRIDAFKLWCWGRLLRVPWTAGRSNQLIIKEINAEYSLEGLILKLKHQYFGHLMGRVDLLEKTLILVKIEGWRRREKQRMKWLDSITNSMDMSLSNILWWLKW